MNRIFIILLLLASSFSVASVHQSDHQDETIKDILVKSTTGIHFRTVGAMTHPNGEECTSTSWYKIDINSDYQKEIYSLLLTAKAQSKTVTFYLDGCTGGYPKILYVY